MKPDPLLKGNDLPQLDARTAWSWAITSDPVSEHQLLLGYDSFSFHLSIFNYHMGFLTFSFFFLAIQSASVRGGRGATPPSQASSGTSINSQSGMRG